MFSSNLTDAGDIKKGHFDQLKSNKTIKKDIFETEAEASERLQFFRLYFAANESQAADCESQENEEMWVRSVPYHNPVEVDKD